MESVYKIALTSALIFTAGAAAGVELGVNTMNERELPVLVQVNSKGKVTRTLPAVPLSPALTRSLRDTISHWVTGPATDKHLRPIGSQMIMRVALLVDHADDGKYQVHFHYVSRQAVAAANSASFWRWNGNQLALITDPNGMREPGFMGGYYGGAVGGSPGVGSSSVSSSFSANTAVAASISSSSSSGGGGHGGGKH